ncbi:MAG: hypothetical protein AAF492_06520 [Verrucomicrobiota bacterium]
MKKAIGFLLLGGMFTFITGCVTPDRYISDVRLGMTTDEVKYTMGDPFAVRAAKMYEGEEWIEVWEYRPPIISLAAFTDKYDRDYQIVFKNGKVIQWGEPGDLHYRSTVSGNSAVPVFDPEAGN